MGSMKATIKLRAVISVDIVAKDYLEAAERQKEIKELTDKLDYTYESASYEFKEWRNRGPKSSLSSAPKRGDRRKLEDLI